jgi:hypothetical protein
MGNEEEPVNHNHARFSQPLQAERLLPRGPILIFVFLF